MFDSTVHLAVLAFLALMGGGAAIVFLKKKRACRGIGGGAPVAGKPTDGRASKPADSREAREAKTVSLAPEPPPVAWAAVAVALPEAQPDRGAPAAGPPGAAASPAVIPTEVPGHPSVGVAAPEDALHLAEPQPVIPQAGLSVDVCSSSSHQPVEEPKSALREEVVLPGLPTTLAEVEVEAIGSDLVGQDSPLPAAQDGASEGELVSETAAIEPASACPQEAAPPASSSSEPDGVPTPGGGQEPKPLRTRIAPEKRGGVRLPSDERPEGALQSRESRGETRARFVCFNQQRIWHVAVELDDDWGENVQSVLQGGTPLQRANAEDNRWLLTTLGGEFRVVTAEDGNEDSFALAVPQRDYLLFKLLEAGEADEGALVAAPSRGGYLLVLPESWTVLQHSDLNFAKERNLALDECTAYTFSVAADARPRLSLRKPTGPQIAVHFRLPCFELVGNSVTCVDRDSEPPFFLGGPPRVRAAGADTWAEIKTMVLGEEGRGRGKWRTHFKPVPVGNEVELPAELEAKGSGWFFLRFYDANDDLVDSLDFKFCTALRSVRLEHHSPLPEPRQHGHQAVGILFEHDQHCGVDCLGQHCLPLQSTATTTRLTAPASPSQERLEWQVTARGRPPLKSAIRIERVWWALGSEGQVPADTAWTDQSLTAGSDDFRAHSQRVLWVRLPWPGWADELLLGFQCSTARPYPASSLQREVAIPLRDFSTAEQLEVIGPHWFNVWFTKCGTDCTCALLSPVIAGQCKRCNQRVDSAEEARGHFAMHWQHFFMEPEAEEVSVPAQHAPSAAFDGSRYNAGTLVLQEYFRLLPGQTPAAFREEVQRLSSADRAELVIGAARELGWAICACGHAVQNASAETCIAHLRDAHDQQELFRVV